ncbi:MAG: hypothetical protein ACOYK1_02615 [Vampirovibrionia bacterium]
MTFTPISRPTAALEKIFGAVAAIPGGLVDASVSTARAGAGLFQAIRRQNPNAVSERLVNDFETDIPLRAKTVIDNLPQDSRALSLDAVQNIYADLFTVDKNYNLKINENSQVFLNPNRETLFKVLAELASDEASQGSKKIISEDDGDKQRNSLAKEILEAVINHAETRTQFFHLNRHRKSFSTEYRPHITIPVIDIIAADKNSAKHYSAVANFTEGIIDHSGSKREDFMKLMEFKLNGLEMVLNKNYWNTALIPHNHTNGLGTLAKENIQDSLDRLISDPKLRLELEQEDQTSMEKIYRSLAQGLTHYIPDSQYDNLANAAVELLSVCSTDTKNFPEKRKDFLDIVHGNAQEIILLETKYQKAKIAHSQDSSPLNLAIMQEAEADLTKKKREVEASYVLLNESLEKFGSLDVKGLFMSKLLGEANNAEDRLQNLKGLYLTEDLDLKTQFDIQFTLEKELATQKKNKAQIYYNSLIDPSKDAAYKSVINFVISNAQIIPDADSPEKSNLNARLEEKDELKSQILSLDPSLTASLSNQDLIRDKIIKLKDRQLVLKENILATPNSVNAVQELEKNEKLTELLDSYRDYHEIAKLYYSINRDDNSLSTLDDYSNRSIKIDTARTVLNETDINLKMFDDSDFKSAKEKEFLSKGREKFDTEFMRFITALNPSDKHLEQLAEGTQGLALMYTTPQNDSLTNLSEVLVKCLNHLAQMIIGFMEAKNQQGEVTNVQ